MNSAGTHASIMKGPSPHSTDDGVPSLYNNDSWVLYNRGKSGSQNRMPCCHSSVLHFKQQGICIMARRASSPTSTPGVLVPAAAIFTTLVQLPEVDLLALGFNATRTQNHPCNGVLSMFLVLPPVSRPAMRTVNLKPGNPNHALAQGTVTPPQGCT